MVIIRLAFLCALLAHATPLSSQPTLNRGNFTNKAPPFLSNLLREEYPPMCRDCEKVDPAAGLRYIPSYLCPAFPRTFEAFLPTYPTLLGT